MRKAINTERIEGRVYQHNLTIKTVQNQTSANFGKEFISGQLEVAVDEEGLNIIPVHYTYVTETTSAGNKNATYANLKKIIDEGKTWIANGKDEAQKVRIDTAIALNDFYTGENNDELVSVKTNEGGFVTLVNELGAEGERNTFSADMVITGVKEVEANEERNEDAYVTVKGAIFNFRNSLLPVEFTVRHKDGMKYFLDLEVSNSAPIFTKAWNITGTAKVPYDFGDEKILTSEELTKAMQDRQTLLAEIKTRSDEYRAQKAASTPAPATTAAPGGFNF